MSEQGLEARHVIAIGSGKGGVGKSTVSLNLALALAQEGASVGLLDADFYGPNIPVMVGLTRTQEAQKWSFWRHPGAGGLGMDPIERFGVKIMSVGFLLGERQQVFSWGPLVGQIGYQMLHHVRWGRLDYLIIDLPPGAAEVQQELLRSLSLSGTVVVVGPQDVAHLDAKKIIEMLKKLEIRVLGGVENMSRVRCPCCGEQFEVFPHVRTDRSIWSLGVPLLGSVPLGPAVAHEANRGKPIVVSQPDSAEARAFRKIATSVVRRLHSTEDGESSPS
ncbi:ATP-binding protein [Rubrobacter taiwanensis]|jgi:ATP-binding protein involved in chromosome partitioning|uniref:Iron-sulfur cluster carrier protein n=1 Tax=Rubrobacter taiwanensis TaxID=185139 RepID=A0A4R1BRA1_9ACTN|nr:P-loop NTPase [Rubrobacter taiwanensis]TCJ19846.1 ATP-binding protein [Rubrobacter taiwanensis]